jgi:enoyl-CoA hydratase
MLIQYQASAWSGDRRLDELGERGSMSAVTSELRDDGIRVVTMAHPPVNALTVQGWFDVAAALDEASVDLNTKVVILRAEGKGYNAGVDIKEMQNTTGFDALIGANRGCYAAFKAVYECAVPVIAAVNGFCVGGGVGLVGNADIVVASDDAYFGVPEVKQGALGAATHMARLVPQQMMRALYFTAATIPATELHRFGSVYRLVPREQLLDAALEVAANIADKDTRVIRAAKEALNGIEPVDVNKSYRFEQGFTFELNLAGVSDELRDAFAGTAKSGQSAGTEKAKK